VYDADYSAIFARYKRRIDF